MAKLTDLPIELLKRITDYVKQEKGISTLRSASLVCRCLTPAFQEGLFSRVILDEKASILRSDGRLKHTIDRFSSIVQVSPHLLSYIRILGIWLTNEALLNRTFSHASRIRKLRLTDELKFTRLSHNLGTETRATISFALATLPLEQIHLDGVQRLPLSLLTQCHSLRHLSLTSIDVDPQDLSLLSAGEPLIILETLQLTLDSVALPLVTEWLLDPKCPFDVSHLKRLYLNAGLGCNESIHFWGLMQKCASSLEILMFDLTPSDDDRPIFDLSILPNLRIIKIRMLVDVGSDDEIWVRRAFHNISSNSLLQSVYLDMLCNDENHDIIWAYSLFIHEMFSKTNVFITVYGSTSYIEEEVFNDIMDQYFDVENISNIELNFSCEDAEDNFLEFSDSSEAFEA